MGSSMSLEEFAALIGVEAEQVDEWRAAGLLDPAGTGRFDDLDLLRMMTIRRYDALGWSTERMADDISKGEVEPFLGEYIYPRGPQLSIEDAARKDRDRARAAPVPAHRARLVARRLRRT